jgi:hypothetical protein
MTSGTAIVIRDVAGARPSRKISLTLISGFRAHLASCPAASITASATFGHLGWRPESWNTLFIRDLGIFASEICYWGGRRHDQGLPCNIKKRVNFHC